MTASMDATAIVWDLAAPSRITAPTHAGRVLGITVSPDGSTAASLGGDGLALVWDCSSGNMQTSLQVSVAVDASAGLGTSAGLATNILALLTAVLPSPCVAITHHGPPGLCVLASVDAFLTKQAPCSC